MIWLAVSVMARIRPVWSPSGLVFLRMSVESDARW